jgi:DNA-binding NtrC family response regulator
MSAQLNDPSPPVGTPPDAWPQAAFLVVDDEPGMQHFLRKTLETRAALVHCVGDTAQARERLRHHRFDVIVMDIALPGESGLALLRELRAQRLPCEVIMITAFADLDTAIEALRADASDFLVKPFRVPQLLSAIGRALERAQLRRENWVLRRTLSQRTPAADGLVGSSIAIKGLQAALKRLASVHSTVLLTGESGTGKELAALALHRLSPRAAAPFVPINCASIAPTAIEAELFGRAGREHNAQLSRDGLFVYAEGGTLFLDEIGGLSMPLQAAFLRVLEDRYIRPVGSEHEIPVDVRIVAASNRSLADEVAAGRFRADLYYRLQVVEIHLPPLRAHKEDIPELVAHFVGTLAPQLRVPPITVSTQEMAFLAQYDWPGNVRELRNLIERSLIVGSLNVSALYSGLDRDTAGRPRVDPARSGSELVDLPTLERRHIVAVLDSVAGDKSRAARLLGISRRTLERRAAEWGL